jgi:hypothetical protein
LEVEGHIEECKSQIVDMREEVAQKVDYLGQKRD